MLEQLKNLYKLSFHHPNLHWLELIFVNYYWILVFGALLNIFFKITWFADTFFPLLIYALVIVERKKIKYSYFDFLWFLYLLVVLYSWSINNYPYKGELILRCLSEQFAYSMCYWVVRKNHNLSSENIIKCAYFPLLITSIIGVYCYFKPPSWYMAMTTIGVTDFEVLEFLRLRSIFIDGYIISYFLGISIIYLLFQLSSGALKNKRMAYFLLIIFSITLFFTLTRTVIGAVLISVVICTYYAYHYHKINNIKPIIIGVIAIIVASGIFISKLDGYEKDFITAKVSSITQDSSESVLDRLFLNKKGLEYKIIGDGVGRHNLYVDKYTGHFSLRDGEYNKMIIEQGYIGFVVFILIVISALTKCVFNFKHLAFELMIILFLLICMVAANPISTGDKHPIIYWLILGQIANFKGKYGIDNYCNV